MAKRQKEELQGPSKEWMNTFADLMNLLLCFFVLLFSMSTVDAQKFEMIAASFSQTFSIFSAGSRAIGDGVLISAGVSQLNELDRYINSTG
ncbi:MAG: flagellar motor protein MotB, partial [Lachnospiraceae bacterium]